MSAAHNISVTEELYREVCLRAEQTGISMQDWVSAVLEARVHIERQTEEFFKKRAAGASSLSLGELLNKSPDRPPDSGDEFEL